MKVVNVKSKKRIDEEKRRDELEKKRFEELRRTDEEKMKIEMEKKKIEDDKKQKLRLKKIFRKHVWAVFFLTNMKAKADHAFTQASSKNFINERNAKFREVIEPALHVNMIYINIKYFIFERKQLY